MKTRTLLWVAVGSTLALGIGWWAGTSIRSPEDIAASTGPPTPSVVVADVEFRRLSDTVVIRGKVTAAGRAPIAGIQPEQGTAVVTRLIVSSGDVVQEGDLLAEVSGRPILVLQGAFPMYRDLTPGVHGPDVRQLQEGLLRLGYDVSSDGFFGGGTQAAVSNWFNSLGVDPVGPSNEELRSLDAARASVAEALSNLQQAQESQQGGRIRAAQRELEAAQAELAILDEQIGITVPQGEISFVRALPGRVEAVEARVGASVSPDKPMLFLSLGNLTIKTLLTQPDRQLVELGDAVRIQSEVLGRSFRARIASIADELSSQEDVQGFKTRIEAVNAIPAVWAGQDVRATIRAASTTGDVLVVPLAAITSGADGSTHVVRIEPDGSQTRIVVRAGLSADGYVAIEPQGAELNEGDSVVISW